MAGSNSRIVLGIDVGAQSLGSLLVDVVGGKVLFAGVRIFPEGVDRDQQGGEQSKSQARRIARGQRRQIQRRADRKRLVQTALEQIGLLPTDPVAFAALMDRDPYEIRGLASRTPLKAHELGRVLFHLATRRGFLSNRKTDRTREAQGMLKEIGELQKQLDSNEQLLGEYLHAEVAAHTHDRQDLKRPVRGRHTRREMFEREFDAIWTAQAPHHPQLTDALRYGRAGKSSFPVVPSKLDDASRLTPEQRWQELARRQVSQFGLQGLLFFQRKMYWPRWIIGQCELTSEAEPTKRCRQKRCSKADRAAQHFRILQEANNLKVMDRGGDRRLTDAERAIVVEALMTTKEQTFVSLRKKLKFTENMTFNIERGGREKLKGHETDGAMSGAKGVGKRWKTLDDATKDAIVEICVTEDSEEAAIRQLQERCGLIEEEARRAAALNLPDNQMRFCRDAIVRLIPHLERGLLLMANDASDSALHAAGYLRPDQRVIDQKDELPPPPDLPNPIVRQALYEVRKVVNAIIREYGKPDRIHVELAREAKQSFEARQEIRFDNAKRTRLREQIATRLNDEFGVKPTRNNVNRYLLWQEQDGDCLYCGEKIGAAQLFNGDADVDHILPRWRSLDDSMGNKVVCHRRCNDEKRDRSPREWLESLDRPRYERMLQIAKKLDYGKRRRLEQLDIQLDNFIERQLRDTSYIAICVKEYLECLGVTVVCPRGGMTADLRHWWGLNNILDVEKKGRKNRNDHRHHALDALVIALTDHARLHALANARGENMPAPWPGFLNDARMAVLNVNVSYKGQRRISGALHESTFYGPTDKPYRAADNGDVARTEKEWIEDPKVFVRRKSVTEIKNAKHLGKVRDKTIRDILATHLREKCGVDPYGSKAYPKDAFKGENTPRMPPRKKGNQGKLGVPIKKVRMLEESETFRPVSEERSYQYVKPGNNHHIIYWAQGDGANERWSADVITMWDAAKRARAGKPPIDRTPPKGMRFVMSLSNGEMFEMVGSGGEIQLCVVRKMDQRSRRVYYKLHTDARETDEINKDNLYLSPKKMQEGSARKVTVDPLGRVRWAND